MRSILPPALALASALAIAGCLHAPMPWSPDGKWLAYTVEVRPIGPMLRPGWLFDPALADGPAGVDPGSRTPPTAYRLWASRADGGASVLLEDSPGPITAPGWSPDGRALAFGRVVPEAGGSGRFEVVILEGLARRRVVLGRALPVIGGEAARLPGQAVAWSPDGRYLAVPQLGPDGLAIIQADNGRQVNAINDAFLPSWSPDGGRLAFYVRGTTDTLHCIDSALGQARPLGEAGQAVQAPAWTRDGLSLLYVARQPTPREADPRGEHAELKLIRVRVDTGQAEALRSLTDEVATGRDRSVEGVSIAFDREGENLFCSTVVEGQPHQITWIRPRDNAVYKKFSVLDFSAPMGSLSLSPDGRTLAARVGSLDHLSAPALCDLESPDLRSRLIAPDDGSRVEWIATLLRSARSILAALPTAAVDPRDPSKGRSQRPTLLPIHGEFEPNSEPTFRLRRIGRMGRPLCDRPTDAPPAGPELAAVLDEARLFFDYLREDYSAAMGSLEALEARVDSPDRRLRLLGVRAQIFLAQGQLDRAGQTIAYLRAHEPRPARRLESTGGRFTLTPEPIPGRGWPDYLAARAEAVRSMLHDEGPALHVNPDALRPGPGLEPPGPRLDLLLPDRLLPIEPIPADPPAVRAPRPRREIPGVRNRP
jgi:Tol biopolymer transport system component